jgi:hypothetical protein
MSRGRYKGKEIEKTDGRARGQDDAGVIDVKVDIGIDDGQSIDKLTSVDVGDEGVLVGVAL